jgi:hypothetical protein
MAISQAWELDGVTVGSSELSIISGTTSLQTNTTVGAYQLWVDAGNMAKGDEFRVRIYEKVEATGGTKKVVFSATLAHVQSEVFVAPTLVLMNGFDFTIQKIAGSDRAFDASVRVIA